MNARITALCALLLAAAPAAGQRTISPGMTEDQVRAVLGAPATTRESAAWKYLYYHNGCPNRCGSDDVVFLEGGRVVAAVFRTSARRFTGAAADRALEQAGGRTDGSTVVPAEDGGPAVVGPIRVRVDGRDADERADARGRTVISQPGEDGEGRITVIRTEGDDPDAPAPIRRRGSREAAADSAEGGLTAGPLTEGEARRQRREETVAPNTTTTPRSSEAQRQPGAVQQRARERGVAPNTIKTQTPPDTVGRP